MKTRQEVEELKQNWIIDPCYEIEDSEGFEEYREELKLFRERIEQKAEEFYIKRCLDKARELGCEGNIKLGKYIIDLEYRLNKLESSQ